jgi:hypothetical protein
MSSSPNEALQQFLREVERHLAIFPDSFSKQLAVEARGWQVSLPSASEPSAEAIALSAWQQAFGTTQLSHARARLEAAERKAALPASARSVEPFVVKQYNDDPHPSIKGNGFDGLTLGDYRDEAETFVNWINERLTAPQSETPAGGTAKVPERETRRVYKADAEEYRSYITARFEKANSGYRFRWLDREWRYEHSDFDERGDFDLLLAAAPSPDGNEESK